MESRANPKVVVLKKCLHETRKNKMMANKIAYTIEAAAGK